MIVSTHSSSRSPSPNRWGTSAPPSFFFAFLLALLLVGSSLQAEESRLKDEKERAKVESQREEGRLTLDAKRWPLERVLDYISRASRTTNVKLHILDATKEEEYRRMPVTVELINVHWRTAVEYIAQKYGFTINDSMAKDGVILLEKQPRVTYTVREDEQMTMLQAINLITKEAAPDLIIAPAIIKNTQPVYFSFKDKPWREALEALLKQYGYVLIEEGGKILRITSKQDEQLEFKTEIIPLMYISPEGARFQPDRPTSVYYKRIAGQTTGEGGQQATTTLLSALRQLSTPEKGTVTHEPRTNQLIIRDTASVIEEMKLIIRQVDVPPKQVKINCIMFTNTINPQSAMGTMWSNGDAFRLDVYGNNHWRTLFPFTPSFRPDTLLSNLGLNILRPVTPEGLSYLKQRGQPTQSNYYDPSENMNPWQSPTQMNLKLATLSTDMVMQFALSQRDVTLMQAPEIVVLDNTEATIFVGEQRRYATTTTTVDSSGIVTTVWKEAEGSPLNTGVQLTVIPHICGQSENLLLEVIPSTDDYTGMENYGVLDNGEAALKLPQTNSKVVVTRMLLRSGETGFIGGLIYDQLVKEEKKIPILGNIPVLGYLFKQTKKGGGIGPDRLSTKKSLNVMITPTILRYPEEDRKIFEEQVEQVRNLISKIELPDVEASEEEEASKITVKK